jgi:hypothetical protein
MNSMVISFRVVMIAVVLFFASGQMIGDQQVFASDGYGGHGFSHGYGPRYSYGPGYPVLPCGSGPYTIINGQTLCTPA